jgi:hypothetical protein
MPGQVVCRRERSLSVRQRAKVEAKSGMNERRRFGRRRKVEVERRPETRSPIWVEVLGWDSRGPRQSCTGNIHIITAITARIMGPRHIFATNLWGRSMDDNMKPSSIEQSNNNKLLMARVQPGGPIPDPAAVSKLGDFDAGKGVGGTGDLGRDYKNNTQLPGYGR